MMEKRGDGRWEKKWKEWKRDAEGWVTYDIFGGYYSYWIPYSQCTHNPP